MGKGVAQFYSAFHTMGRALIPQSRLTALLSYDLRGLGGLSDICHCGKERRKKRDAPNPSSTTRRSRFIQSGKSLSVVSSGSRCEPSAVRVRACASWRTKRMFQLFWSVRAPGSAGVGTSTGGSTPRGLEKYWRFHYIRLSPSPGAAPFTRITPRWRVRGTRP